MMAATLPDDLARSPFYVVREYLKEFNRASYIGAEDPDGVARRFVQSKDDAGEFSLRLSPQLIGNAFCPTGKGGGIKNTCSSSRTDRGEILDYSRAVKDSIYFAKEKSGTRTCSLEHHCEPFAQVLQRELKVRKIPSTIEWKQSKSEPIHHVFVRTEDGLYIDAGGVFGSEEALLKNFSRANDLIDEGWEEYTGNAFCPTGKGGGIDNSCPSRKIGISDKQREMLRDFQYIKERKGLFWVRKSSDLYDRMIGSEEFSDLVRSLPQRVGTVYRGVSLDWDEANFNPGDSLELDKATATTAKSEVKALDYANENFVPEEKKGGKNRIPVVFEFRNASGADLRSVGESSEDLQEVILPRGDVFIIESVTKGNIGSKYYYIPGGLKVVLTRKLTSNSNLSENAFCPTGKGGGIKNTCPPRKTTNRGETLIGAVRDPETKKWLVDGEEAPEHIQKAGIPPAWQDVYVNLDPEGTLLAIGLDKKGRVQARYSDSHNARQAEVKFKRVTELRRKRQQILAELDDDAKDPALRENAECLRVVMQTGIRPGGKGDTMADYQSYGATTLEGRHVRIGEGGSVSLVFVAGKSHGQEKTYPIRDKRTAAMLRRRAEAAGDDGKLFQTDAGSLASYSKTKDGGGFKTKDHRTALGTETAIAAIEEMPVPTTKTEYKKAVAAVGDAVSNTLGNTRSVALKSYIDPVVFQNWRRAAGV